MSMTASDKELKKEVDLLTDRLAHLERTARREIHYTSKDALNLILLCCAVTLFYYAAIYFWTCMYSWMYPPVARELVGFVDAWTAGEMSFDMPIDIDMPDYLYNLNKAGVLGNWQYQVLSIDFANANQTDL